MPSDPFVDELSTLFLRDIDGLVREIELYPTEAAIWVEVPGVPNVGGTLALHLAGNLQHYFGAVLGQSGYVRDRPAEFARRDVPRAEILAEVAAARQAVAATLVGLDPASLAADYPEVLAGRVVSTRQFVVHLLAHLAFHLGQIDYHRRAVTGDRTSAGLLPLAALGRALPPA